MKRLILFWQFESFLQIKFKETGFRHLKLEKIQFGKKVFECRITKFRIRSHQ